MNETRRTNCLYFRSSTSCPFVGKIEGVARLVANAEVLILRFELGGGGGRSKGEFIEVNRAVTGSVDIPITIARVILYDSLDVCLLASGTAWGWACMRTESV
jgi:hypothetical protein